MATPSTSAFVLFGSGPGIGLHVASLFAQKHFQHVVLLSRDKDRLEEDAAAVRAARPGIHVTAIPCDLSELQSVRDALSAIDKFLQAGKATLEVVCFNAARVRPTDLLTEPPEEYEKDFKITNTALLAVTQWAMPHFLQTLQSQPPASFRPTLLVTSGNLHRRPIPALFSLSATKTAQYNLVTSMHEAFGPQGVHVATVLVGGVVSEQAQNLNPTNVANVMWMLYEQDKGSWVKEVDIFQ